MSVVSFSVFGMLIIVNRHQADPNGLSGALRSCGLGPSFGVDRKIFIIVAMPFISGMPGFVPRGESTDKGQRVLPFC
jgi:hypothetical protein